MKEPMFECASYKFYICYVPYPQYSHWYSCITFLPSWTRTNQTAHCIKRRTISSTALTVLVRLEPCLSSASLSSPRSLPLHLLSRWSLVLTTSRARSVGITGSPFYNIDEICRQLSQSNCQVPWLWDFSFNPWLLVAKYRVSRPCRWYGVLIHWPHARDCPQINGIPAIRADRRSLEGLFH